MTPVSTDRITQAFLYAFAPHDLARTRWQITQNPRNERRADLNTFTHSRKLLDHRARVVTMPNNDTLYSSAWLDLSQGPIELSVPDMGRRYYSLAFMDAFTNNFACVSRRTHGGAARTLWIVPPGSQEPAPPHALRIDAPSIDVWLLARLLVDGEGDLPAVRGLQDALVLHPRGPGRPYDVTPDENDVRAFIDFSSEILGRNAPAERDSSVFPRLAEVGLVPGDPDGWMRMPTPLRDAWQSTYPALRRDLKHGSAMAVKDPVSHWTLGLDHLGRYGNDHAYRAYIALTGLGALERDEAIYATTREDGLGRPLDGRHACELHIPADLPVGAFWSLSMYRFEADGRGFFVDNPLRRYTIGDRTPGLRREADGSVRIRMQHEAPIGELADNWLPSPPGAFSLALRLYEPGPALLARRYALPPVNRVDGS